MDLAASTASIRRSDVPGQTADPEAILQEQAPLIAAIPRWRKWRFDETTQADVTQLIRIDIAKARIPVGDRKHIESCVTRIGICRCIDEVRRQVRERRVFEPVLRTPEDAGDATTDADPLRAIVLFERAAAVRRLLETIGETCRTAIEDFYVRGLKYREIARERGLAINTVGSRLAKCLDRLRALIEADPELREELAARID